MTLSLKQQVTLRLAMTYAGDMAANAPKPERYRWAARWWRLHARESKNPGECLQYAENQMTLYRDILARPAHYTDILRPVDISDWQRSGLSTDREFMQAGQHQAPCVRHCEATE